MMANENEKNNRMNTFSVMIVFVILYSLIVIAWIEVSIVYEPLSSKIGEYGWIGGLHRYVYWYRYICGCSVYNGVRYSYLGLECTDLFICL